MYVRNGCWFVAAMCCVVASAEAQYSPKDLVNAMLVQEHQALIHRDNYMYLSNERSERTGQHLWTERVVETPSGRVRFLLAEDGKPLSPDRVKQERGRLATDAAHPEAFVKRELAQKNEETHGRQMMDLLPKAFILENLKEQNGDWRIDFRPDPKFSPTGIEERVLHGMSGWLLVNERQMRVHHIEARLPQNLSIGFGLLNVKMGSNFESTKAVVDGSWRTVHVISDIRAHAALLKSIARNQDVMRSEFKRVDNNLTVAQAVALAEQ